MVRKRMAGGLLAAIFAAASGCGGDAPRAAEPAANLDTASRASAGRVNHAHPIGILVDRAWRRTDPAAPTGSLLIFLSDGTLLMDSCREVYRLEAWEAASDSTIRWSEDGMPISARLLSVEADELVMRLQLTSEDVEQRYEPAEAPYVCPEMAR